MAKPIWRVQVYGEVDPGVLSFGVLSRTREGKRHECAIDLRTGETFCTCEWAVMSGLNRSAPTIADQPCWHCRRVLQEAGWLIREMERDARTRARRRKE